MSAEQYYVGEITLQGGAGYTSLHRSRGGAERALLEWAAAAGVNAARYFDLDGHHRVAAFGISYLPLLP